MLHFLLVLELYWFAFSSVQLLREGNGTPLQYSYLENPMDGGAWWAGVHGVAKSRTQLSDFTFTFHFHALEKEMAPYSSVLAWRIPGTGELGGLPSMELHRFRHDWSDLAAAAVQSLSHVRLFVTPWTAAHQDSLSINSSRSSLKLTSIESVVPSSHLILSSPSPPALNLSQHQGLFQWVSSLHQVAKVLEFQLQNQSFQWTPRTDLL